MSDGQVDEVMPDAAWAFDDEVTAAFDNMLERSIPQYDVMRQMVTDLAAKHLKPGGRLLDIGCSRGEAMRRVADGLNDEHRRMGTKLVGLEISEPMVAAAKERFADNRDATIYRHDLREPLPVAADRSRYDVVLSVLTLMFVPPEHRARIMREIAGCLRPDGALLLVEKLAPTSARIDQNLTDIYRQHKRAMGYTEEQIVRKAASLEGVLMPYTAGANLELIRDAGFGAVECVWRWGQFAAFYAVGARA